MREWEKWEKAANTSNIFSYAFLNVKSVRPSIGAI